MGDVLYIIINALITAIVAVPVGFLVYYFIYQKFTNRKMIKNLVIEYVKLANTPYKDDIGGRFRNILNEEGQVINIKNNSVYPSTKAIMQWVQHNKVIQKGSKFGVKYDEPFFISIVSELIMDGELEPIQDEQTDEMIGFKYSKLGNK